MKVLKLLFLTGFFAIINPLFTKAQTFTNNSSYGCVEMTFYYGQCSGSGSTVSGSYNLTYSAGETRALPALNPFTGDKYLYAVFEAGYDPSCPFGYPQTASVDFPCYGNNQSVGGVHKISCASACDDYFLQYSGGNIIFISN